MAEQRQARQGKRAAAGPSAPLSVNGSHKDSAVCSGRFRTFSLADGFTREVLEIEIELNLPAPRVISVLERVVAWRPSHQIVDG